MKCNKWRNFSFFAMAFLIAGCQSYEAKPLDIGNYRNSLESRLLDIEPVAAFAERLSKKYGTPSNLISATVSPQLRAKLLGFFITQNCVSRD